MSELTALEHDVLKFLVMGSGRGLRILQEQLRTCKADVRELTGTGFFTHLLVAKDAPRLTLSGTVRFGDVLAEITGLKHGAGFLLYVENGALDMLEGYSFDEPWPNTIHEFSIRYVSPDRRSIPAELA